MKILAASPSDFLVRRLCSGLHARQPTRTFSPRPSRVWSPGGAGSFWRGFPGTPLSALLILLLLGGGGCPDRSSAADGAVGVSDSVLGGCDSISNNWQPQPLGSAANVASAGGLANFFGIWGASPTAVYAVGSEGKVLFFDGISWTSLATPTTAHLTSVWGTSASDVWVSGFAGTVLHFDGTSWLDRSPPDDLFRTVDGGVPGADAGAPARKNLWGIWAGGEPGKADVVYTVGDNGFILVLQQDKWSRIASDVEDNLTGVWGASKSRVFVVGEYGTVLAGTSKMTKQSTGISKALWAVWGRSESDVYAVGVSGTVLHYNGSKWRELAGAPKQYLRGIWGPSALPGVTYIVGWDGTLLRMSGGPGFAQGATFDSYGCLTRHRLEGIWGANLDDSSSGADAGGAGGTGGGEDADGGADGDLDAGPDAAPDPRAVIWVCGVSGSIFMGP